MAKAIPVLWGCNPLSLNYHAKSMQIQSLPESFFDNVLIELQSIEAVPAAKLAGARRRLCLLYSLAALQQTYSSRQIRSELDIAAKDLNREVDQLRDTLRYRAWFIERPLQLAASDLRSQERRSRAIPEPVELISPSCVAEELEEALVQLTRVLAHFKAMADSFDKIEQTDAGLLEWIEQGSHLVDRQVRAELSTYLTKGGRGLKPDTLILRHIRHLYEYIYDRDFSIKAISTVELEKRIGARNLARLDSQLDEGDEAIARYEGAGVVFAATIIKSLGLQGCFIAADRDTVDGKLYSYEQALAGRPVNSTELVNRIGHTWKNDRQRRSKK
jgi:hypothetical protein